MQVLQVSFYFLSCQDDNPRVYPTAPQPVPVLFSLDGIALERLDDGVLRLRRESYLMPEFAYLLILCVIK